MEHLGQHIDGIRFVLDSSYQSGGVVVLIGLALISWTCSSGNKRIK